MVHNREQYLLMDESTSEWITTSPIRWRLDHLDHWIRWQGNCIDVGSAEWTCGGVRCGGSEKGAGMKGR